MKQVILITGASSGIGRTCADYFHGRGHIVYGASRSIRSSNSVCFRAVEMDVNDSASVQNAIGQVLEEEKRIDVVVNCAGFGIAGAVEDTSVEEARAQFETNLFGIIRICKAVLPVMRQQRSGLIANISSIGGVVSVPFQGVYSASKFALEGLTEALRMEVLPFGIRVVLIEPGDFKTQFTMNRSKVGQSQQSMVYRELFDRALSVTEQGELSGNPPLDIARLLERIMKNPSPRLRYTVGPFLQRLSITLSRNLPYSLYERLMMKYFQIR